MIVLTGATGTVGGYLAVKLAERGHPARAIVRDLGRAQPLRQLGLDIIPGDMARPATLGRALKGATRLFLLSPDLPGEEKFEAESNVIEAAADAGVSHVVYLSVAGADVGDTVFARWHGRTERALARTPMSWTFLRPNGFMSNIVGPSGLTRQEETLALPAGEGRVSVVHPGDIAAVAASALTDPQHEHRAYLLTGPKALTFREQAAQLSALLGRVVSYVDLPEEAARESILASGTPALVADALLDFYRHVRAGNCAQVSDDIEKVTGSPARSFTEFIQELL
ncbi:SDR family oxidoreductase [Fodinicola feengrottensis]|uniref:SDR family oxidoreductase n=1 Tax=Fodinicola feengrottensis TaxID=435914 RepID=A0ABN2HKZ2_9ACTN